MPLIDRHLRWRRAAGQANATLVACERLLRHMDQHLPEGLDRADENQLADYFGHYAQPATLCLYDGFARAYYRWAVDRDHLTCDPMVGIIRPRRHPGVPHPCSDDELALALTAPAPYGRAMLLAARAGLRCGEITRARRRHIVGTRLRVDGKGGRQRMVPLDEMVLAAIADEPDWLVGRELPDGELTDRQRPIWRRVGLPDTHSLHSGRHWFATRLLECGALITEVQRLLGHASLATTQVYLQVVDARLEAAVARLPRVAPEPVSGWLGRTAVA